MDEPQAPSALYRIFDSDDRLLYVGVAYAVLTRIEQHRLTKSWFAAIAKITLEHFPTRTAAMQAEMAAIKTEAPLYNIQWCIVHRPRYQGPPINRRQRIRELRKADPQITAAEMARRLGISRERVRQLLKDMGMVTDVGRARRERRGLKGDNNG